MPTAVPQPSFLAQPSVRDLRPFLVTEIDGAKLLGIGRAQIKQLISEGEVDVVDVAGQRRITVVSILNYVVRLEERAAHPSEKENPAVAGFQQFCGDPAGSR